MLSTDFALFDFVKGEAKGLAFEVPEGPSGREPVLAEAFRGGPNVGPEGLDLYGVRTTDSTSKCTLWGSCVHLLVGLHLQIKQLMSTILRHAAALEPHWPVYLHKKPLGSLSNNLKAQGVAPVRSITMSLVNPKYQKLS